MLIGEDEGEAGYQAGSTMMELLQGWLTVAGLSEHGTDSHNQGDRGSCPSASFSGCQKSGVTSQSMIPHGGCNSQEPD